MSRDDELQAVLLTGPERDEAVAEIHKQMAEWGLKLPDVEPRPLHFGLGNFRETGETEFWVANETEAGYCGKFLFVFDGQTCPYHHHDVKHETFFVMKGTVTMHVDGEDRVLEQGDLLVMPPGMNHSFTGRGGPSLLLEVSMPSTTQDNFFADKRIGKDGVI